MELARLIWSEPGSPDEEEVRRQAELVSAAIDVGAAHVLRETHDLASPVRPELWLRITASAALELAPLFRVSAELSDLLTDGIAGFAARTLIALAGPVRERLIQEPTATRGDFIGWMIGAVFADAFGLYRGAYDDLGVDMVIVLSLFAPDADRLAAAKRLVPRYSPPVSPERMEGHRQPYQAALHDRADADGTSMARIEEAATQNAVVIVGLDANSTHEQAYLRVGATRRKVVNPGVGIVPRHALPKPHLEAWFRARLSNEVMDSLLPLWRESEQAPSSVSLSRGLRHDVSDEDGGETTLADLLAAPEDALDSAIAQEKALEAMHELTRVLESASPQQRDIADVMLDLIEGGYPEHGREAEAARRLDISPAAARVQLHRWRKKLSG